jgi:hypothetical protein
MPTQGSTVTLPNGTNRSGNTMYDLSQNINHWVPGLNGQGQYQWANPGYANAVPQANIPGAPLGPNTTYQNTAANIQAFSDLFPYLQGSINSQTLPTALTQLQASQATSPGYADLMTQLYAQYGPQLNAIGSGITGQNMANYVANQNAILSGPGQDLLKSGYNASQIFDAPYYQARQQAGDSIGKLLNSIDLSGNLSGSETNQIGQGLAREGVQRGNLNAPSNADVVANAMQYGNAAYQRKAQAQTMMGNAIQSATSFLPQAKSGVDVFGTGTGAGVPTNPGNSLFTGINTNFGQNAGTDFLSAITGTGNTAMQGVIQTGINQQNIDANKKDWSDFLEQNSQSFANVAGGVAGLGGKGCWIAREVYGNDNPRWIAIREYLLSDAPVELLSAYHLKGEKVANVLKKNVGLKLAMKQLMDRI